jgi:hypothetical protein
VDDRALLLASWLTPQASSAFAEFITIPLKRFPAEMRRADGDPRDLGQLGWASSGGIGTFRLSGSGCVAAAFEPPP